MPNTLSTLESGLEAMTTNMMVDESPCRSVHTIDCPSIISAQVNAIPVAAIN